MESSNRPNGRFTTARQRKKQLARQRLDEIKQKHRGSKGGSYAQQKDLAPECGPSMSQSNQDEQPNEHRQSQGDRDQRDPSTQLLNQHNNDNQSQKPRSFENASAALLECEKLLENPETVHLSQRAVRRILIDGNCFTEPIAKSKFVDELEKFLPKLREANQELQGQREQFPFMFASSNQHQSFHPQARKKTKGRYPNQDPGEEEQGEKRKQQRIEQAEKDQVENISVIIPATWDKNTIPRKTNRADFFWLDPTNKNIEFSELVAIQDKRYNEQEMQESHTIDDKQVKNIQEQPGKLEPDERTSSSSCSSCSSSCQSGTGSAMSGSSNDHGNVENHQPIIEMDIFVPEEIAKAFEQSHHGKAGTLGNSGSESDVEEETGADRGGEEQVVNPLVDILQCKTRPSRKPKIQVLSAADHEGKGEFTP